MRFVINAVDERYFLFVPSYFYVLAINDENARRVFTILSSEIDIIWKEF